jgi:phasin
MSAMEATATKAKVKPTPSVFDSPKFEMPKFEMPKFDMPKMEVPAAFREIAEKSVVQAKEGYEKMKAAAEEATDVLEETYATATKGSTEYGMKVIDAARANTNAAFDFFTQFMAVKSLSEAVELSTAHARKQFEVVTAQTKELTTLAQKVANEASEPLKSGVTKAFAKVA